MNKGHWNKFTQLIRDATTVLIIYNTNDDYNTSRQNFKVDTLMRSTLSG